MPGNVDNSRLLRSAEADAAGSDKFPPVLSPNSNAPNRALLVVGSLALFAAVFSIGTPDLDAPWIQGDEYIFIVRNPDVTGEGADGPLLQRWLGIFGRAHEDLYQPITILSYAIEWSLWGENRIFHMRLTDVLIHALNALLVWAALRALLLRLQPESRGAATLAGWVLALVWALHPMLVSAFAADMGRTHLLAATFTLLSLLMHLRALRPGGLPWFFGAFVALAIAMLNKPVVGWVIVVFAIEWALIGLRATLTSARVYLVGVMCLGFAALTLWTTKGTIMMEESPLPLMGDPVSRAALGWCIYLRNFLVPADWLSGWYPPDIRTRWDHPLVWLGLALLVFTLIAIVVFARMKRGRGAAIGLSWVLSNWLPISGLVGARVLAAQDRYFYLPAVGLLLALGGPFCRWLAKERSQFGTRRLLATAAAIVLAGVAIPWDRYLCYQSRSTLRRAVRAQRLNPEDPRVAEYAAAAYDFTSDHDAPEWQVDQPPNFLELMHHSLLQASALAEKDTQYFATDHDRAALHRRLSYSLWNIRDFAASLAEAQFAQRLEPEDVLTWLRLAHAYRSLGQYDDAVRAYDELISLMPDGASDCALRYTEFGDLLLNQFDDYSRALEMFRAALLCPTTTPETKHVAWLGAARCEVLVGKGSDGYQLAREALEADPEDLEAMRIIALYHLRSEHRETAEAAYGAILADHPTDYESLRGYQSACALNGNWHDPTFAWLDATEHEPDNIAFRAHFVWCAACDGREEAAEWADELLEIAPANRFACLAHMLVDARQDRLESALNWIRLARTGPALPRAREFRRAERTLWWMIEHGELPAQVSLMRAALWFAIGEPDTGRKLIEEYLSVTPDTAWNDLAEEILRLNSAPTNAP